MVIILGGLGLIIGSFLNVLIFRQETGEGLMGRSHCRSCRKTLTPLELIPLISWMLQRGKCRSCKTSISAQYPLVEFATATLFVIVGSVHADFVELVLALSIVSLLVAITVYDIRHTLIPDVWSYPLAALAFVYGLVVEPELSFVPLALHVIAGPLAALPLYALWFVSGGRWMGFGDVKLAFAIGWVLGAWDGFVAIFFSFVIGAVVSVCILLPLPYLLTFAQKIGLFSLRREGSRFTMESEVPFGPFLVAGCLILWISHLYGVQLPLLP